MDIQLKRGILDVCVLAAIKGEDTYGYKIIKDIKPYIFRIFQVKPEMSEKDIRLFYIHKSESQQTIPDYL